MWTDHPAYWVEVVRVQFIRGFALAASRRPVRAIRGDLLGFRPSSRGLGWTPNPRRRAAFRQGALRLGRDSERPRPKLIPASPIRSRRTRLIETVPGMHSTRTQENSLARAPRVHRSSAAEYRGRGLRQGLNQSPFRQAPASMEGQGWQCPRRHDLLPVFSSRLRSEDTPALPAVRAARPRDGEVFDIA
jgi:hypothetical protein